MDAVIPLGEMTVAEKLRAMETIWDDLRSRENEVDSPAWHGDVLASRQRRIDLGEADFSDWETAKDRIRERSRKRER